MSAQNDQDATRQDDVDLLTAEWARERPDLDTAPFQVFSRISRIARRFDRIRRSVFDEFGLEPWGFDVLSTLRRKGAPYSATPGALMNRLLISSGTMTNRIDRLEEAGLVTRGRSTEDRRTVVVTLTAEGVRRCEAALERLLNAERDLLSSAPEDRAAELGESLRDLLLRFEEQRNPPN